MWNGRNGLLRIWESSTFMTWGSFISKSFGTLIILGLVLSSFDVASVSLWFLFITIYNLQNLIDLGFNPTFSRAIAYSKNNKENVEDTFVNLELKEIIPTMCGIYKYLSVIFLVVLGTLGTLTLIKTVEQTSNEQESWMAWVIICCASFWNLRGNKYVAYLIGMNKVALVRRWEILFSLLRLITQIICISFGANILMLVVATHIWTILSIIRNKILSNQIENGIYKKYKSGKFNKEIFLFMWPSAWRSGLGLSLGYGIVQISSIIYAQIGTATEVAALLLTLRVMDAIVGFSQAPLYSKIPILAQKYAVGEVEYIKSTSKKGMTISLYSFTIACIIWGWLGEYILKLIGSDTGIMPLTFWIIFSLAHLIHRYGAMHIQLYSITNHIIWHKADGISGILYLITVLASYEYIGVYSILLGMLVGYIGFYAWYAAKHSYKKFNLSFWEYDRAVIISLICILIFLPIKSLI